MLVAVIFDPLGRVTPLVSGVKLNIHELHTQKFFELMQEIAHIKFNRAVVPIDAKNMNNETIDTGDASKDLICSAIYVRIERSNGGF